MNCVFICVFNNVNYVDMCYLLLDSIFLYGNLSNDTDILIYTSTEFMNMIKQSHFYNDKIKFEINDTYNSIETACKARLDLFDLSAISNYKKVLYLDTDIIVKYRVEKLFALVRKDILYVLEEGDIREEENYGGKVLFGDEINNYTDKTAFTSGILLFNNCDAIKRLFIKINEDMQRRPHQFVCHDQPYIVYNAFKYKMYNNTVLRSLVVNNDNNILSDKVIHHFPGGPGVYQHKLVSMNSFLTNLKKYNLVPKNISVYDADTCPTKNTKFPLVGIVVSYNYFDSLKFMLPVNYLHFDKIYLITQEDDTITIDFCKQFANVEVRFYNFKNNGRKFDKYGALNYAQKIAYVNHPDSWYMNIDSDIILPNNFIDILSKEDLNESCIYGAIRSNCLKTSQLLQKQMIVDMKENKTFVFNNILHWTKHPPSILGCFQLYKKKCYHRTNIANASYGDYFFGHDNFNLFCNLGNIIYFHLGESGKNWVGKIVSFIDNVQLPIDNLYYKCNIKCKNIYYDKTCSIVNFKSEKTDVNIYDDIWTCSSEFRNDIRDFFSDKSSLKIAEIGSHKGYTTKFLASNFSHVYAVDNNVEWTDFNKQYNKDLTNITYVKLDIYKNNFDVLPDDIEVVFIDADHSYEGCKSDIVNSIKRFNNLQYVILDDYGVWPGVRQIVNQLLTNGVFVFERFIGINHVPSNNGVIKYTNEGIICKLNQNMKQKYIEDDYQIISTTPTPKSSQPDGGKKFGNFLENIHTLQNKTSDIDVLREYLYAIPVGSTPKKSKAKLNIGFMNSIKRNTTYNDELETHKRLLFELSPHKGIPKL
jgi:hypothetical protein